MDSQSAQQENLVTFKNPVKIPVDKMVFIIPLVLLLGFSLGFIFSTILPKNTKNNLPAPTPKPSIDESKLPISLSLLANPIVYEWSGSVMGKVVKKDEHSLTLIDDKDHSITITDLPPAGSRWKTVFLLDKTGKREEASYSAIPIGSNLRGSFYIFKGGPNTPVGNIFVKQ